MRLVTNTALAQQIIARYTSFFSCISSGAELTFLTFSAFGESHNSIIEQRQEIRHICNCIEQNTMVSVNINLQFLHQMMTSALKQFNMDNQRAVQMLERPMLLERSTETRTIRVDSPATKTLMRELQQQNYRSISVLPNTGESSLNSARILLLHSLTQLTTRTEHPVVIEYPMPNVQGETNIVLRPQVHSSELIQTRIQNVEQLLLLHESQIQSEKIVESEILHSVALHDEQHIYLPLEQLPKLMKTVETHLEKTLLQQENKVSISQISQISQAQVSTELLHQTNKMMEQSTTTLLPPEVSRKGILITELFHQINKMVEQSSTILPPREMLRKDILITELLHQTNKMNTQSFMQQKDILTTENKVKTSQISEISQVSTELLHQTNKMNTQSFMQQKDILARENKVKTSQISEISQVSTELLHQTNKLLEQSTTTSLLQEVSRKDILTTELLHQINKMNTQSFMQQKNILTTENKVKTSQISEISQMSTELLHQINKIVEQSLTTLPPREMLRKNILTTELLHQTNKLLEQSKTTTLLQPEVSRKDIFTTENKVKTSQISEISQVSTELLHQTNKMNIQSLMQQKDILHTEIQAVNQVLEQLPMTLKKSTELHKTDDVTVIEQTASALRIHPKIQLNTTENAETVYRSRLKIPMMHSEMKLHEHLKLKRIEIFSPIITSLIQRMQTVHQPEKLSYQKLSQVNNMSSNSFGILSRTDVPVTRILRADPVQSGSKNTDAQDDDSMDIPTIRVQKNETQEIRKESVQKNIAINAPQYTSGQKISSTTSESLSETEIIRITDKVYRAIEGRLHSEKMRRGMW